MQINQAISLLVYVTRDGIYSFLLFRILIRRASLNLTTTIVTPRFENGVWSLLLEIRYITFLSPLSAKSRPDTINTRMINDESRGEKRWFTSHEFTEKLIGKLEETGGAGLKRNHEILSMKPSSLHPSSPSSSTIFRPISPDLRHFPPLGTRGMPD